MTLKNNPVRRLVTVALDNGSAAIATVGEKYAPCPLRAKQPRAEESKASKIMEHVILDAGWLAETRAHEVRRLSAILRNNPTADERVIAESQLSFYLEVQS